MCSATSRSRADDAREPGADQGGREGAAAAGGRHLETLLRSRASKVQRRAAGWGFEWRSVDSALEALKEEVGSSRRTPTPTTRAGDRRRAVRDGVGRPQARVDPESAPRRTVRGLSERYERLNEMLKERGSTLNTTSFREERCGPCSGRPAVTEALERIDALERDPERRLDGGRSVSRPGSPSTPP